MYRGYAKLWRMIADEPWYKKSEVVHLAVHLLIKVKHESSSFLLGKRPMTLEKGQYLTSYSKLSEQTGISFQSVRTCLEILKNCDFLTIKSTNKFSIVTICNKYLIESQKNINQHANQHSTNNQLTNNQQTTNNKEELKELETLETLVEIITTLARNEKKHRSRQKKIEHDFENGFSGISEKEKADWKEAYPALDIEHEILRASQWLISNPKNKKSNFRRFLTNWFDKGQNKASRIEPIKKESIDERLKREAMEMGYFNAEG